MEASDYVAATFWVQAAVAVGTLGALCVAIAVFATEVRLRRRSRVAQVHAWLDWRSRESGEVAVGMRGQYYFTVGYEPIVVVKNAGERPVSDVEAFVWPTRTRRRVWSMSREMLAPGQTYESPVGFDAQYFAETFIVPDRHTGVVTVFRDASGYRWERKANGVVVPRPDIRWYAPWRLAPTGSLEMPPWYAVRARWRDRWQLYADPDFPMRRVPLWLFDIHYARLVYLRKHRMTDVPRWNLKGLWAERERIAQKRFNAGVPMPLWAFKFRAHVWRSRRAAKRADRQFDRDYPDRKW